MNLKKYNVKKKSIKKSSSEDLIVLIAVMARNIMNISVELKKRQTSKELQLSKVPNDFSEGPDFSKLNFDYRGPYPKQVPVKDGIMERGVTSNLFTGLDNDPDNNESSEEILPDDKKDPVLLNDKEVQTVLNTPGRMVVHEKEDYYDEDCDSPGRLLEKAIEEFGIYQDKLLIPLVNGTRLSIAYKFYGVLPKEYDESIKNRCFVYDTWRKSITNTISCVSTAYPGDIITRFSQIEDMVRYSKYKESINEYGFYLRVIRSAIILYQCFGIDNIYDNSLREDFIRSMNDLEFYFTTMSDLVKYNRTVLTRIHAFTFRFIPKDKCGYKFGLRYTPTRRATSSCLDSYIGDNTRFSDKKIADYEDALSHNFPDIEEYDQYVLYSFSVFNTSECNEYVGVDNSIITPERTKKFQKLNSVIIQIYRYYLDKVLGVYDMEDVDYNEVVKNDKFLRENMISLVNDDFNK